MQKTQCIKNTTHDIQKTTIKQEQLICPNLMRFLVDVNYKLYVKVFLRETETNTSRTDVEPKWNIVH